MRQHWIHHSAVFVIAFTLPPVAEPDLLPSLQASHDEILILKDDLWVPVVVVLTRCDVPGDMSPKGAILQWCAKIGSPFVMSSAKTGQNVDEVFELCARIHLHTLAPQRRTD